VYAGLAWLFWLMQARMSDCRPTGRAIHATRAAIGLAFAAVWLDADAGVRVHGWFVPHVRPRGAALILHGNAGSIALRLDWLRMFHGLGYAVLIIDYRGYGRSTGRPTEQGTYADARLAWAHLTNERGFAPGDIVLLGESLGGPIAAHVAARERPRALVLHSTFTSVPDLAAALYRFMPVRWLVRFDYDTRAFLAQVSAPVLIAHSRADDIVPYSHALALHAAANEPKAFLELAGGHNDAFIFRRREWVDALARFLDRPHAATASDPLVADPGSR